MVVIFGWGSGKAKDLGEIAPTTCPQCHNQVFLHHVRSEKQVSLYFVPLVPYGSDEYLLCPICRHGLQVRPEQRPAIDQVRAATSAFRRGTLAPAAYQSTVDQFWRRMGVAPSGEQVLRSAAPGTAISQAPSVMAGPPPGTVPEAGNGPSLAGQLEELGRLHDDGILTDEEFAAAKRRILG